MRTYFVYILASSTRVLYVGVTNDLIRRLRQHKAHAVGSFTDRYRIDRLVHVEATGDARAAIAREKELKGWTRAKKVSLIESTNPHWVNLSLE